MAIALQASSHEHTVRTFYNSLQEVDDIHSAAAREL
jgi:hypothetical protein